MALDLDLFSGRSNRHDACGILRLQPLNPLISAADSQPAELDWPLRFVPGGIEPFFDGSQNWVIAHNDVVAGSNPVSGTRHRGSSVVERVISRFIFYA